MAASTDTLIVVYDTVCFEIQITSNPCLGRDPMEAVHVSFNRINMVGFTLLYRSISNLSFVSKLLERAVHAQLLMYLNENELLPSVQSAYRQFSQLKLLCSKLFLTY